MKEFNLEKALAGAKLVTRCGFEARGFEFVGRDYFALIITSANSDGLPFYFDKNGKVNIDSPYYDLFLAEEEFSPKYGDIIEVSSDNKVWYKRVFMGGANGVYYCAEYSYPSPKLSECYAAMAYRWKYIRPTQEVKEVTIDEIAEKFSVSADKIKIKK